MPDWSRLQQQSAHRILRLFWNSSMLRSAANPLTMEKADCIYTIPGNFGWDDVGNWLALERINATNELGNYIEGDVITVNTQRSTICGKNKLIAAVGVEDLIVIDTEDATLICAKDSTQDVKKVIENLKICNRSSLL